MNIIWSHGWKRYRADARSSGGSFNRLFHRMPKSMKDVLTILFTMLLAVTLVACDSNDNGDGDTPSATADVRFVHASPDAGAVDIFLDDQEVAGDVTFQGTQQNPVPLVSDYFDIPIGAGATIAVRDQDGNNAVNPLDVDAANLQEDTKYTVIVAGAASAGGPEAILLPDRFQGAPDGGIGLRLVHGSARAQQTFGPVDIYVTPPNTDLSQVDPLLSGFEFTENSGSDLLSSPGAFAPQGLSGETQTVSVTAAGSSQAALEVPIGGSGGFPLQEGQYVTGIAADVTWGEGVGALVIAEESQ